MTSAWSQPPAYFIQARGDVLVHLNATMGDAPPQQPYELQGAVSPQEFAHRTREVVMMLKRYSWSVAERVFLVVAVLTSMVVPIVLSTVLSNMFLKKARDANALSAPDVRLNAESEAIFKGRGIGMASVAGVIVLFWIPYFIWKTIGNRRISALLIGFSNADASRGPQYALRWTLTSTNSFARSAVLNVVIPMAPPSTFHPQAYLPPYIHKADGNFTQYAPPQGPRAVAVAAPIGTWEDEEKR